jgi:hypothetical protein
MEQLYLTDEPYYFAGIIFLAFVFTALVFWCYDCFVKCQVSAINSKAVESTAVVSSLFPANVRAQVVGIVEEYNQGKHQRRGKGWKRADKTPGTYSHSKLERLASELDKSKPVAHLYPHCTVLFADISGFTAWSAKRSPSQVFKLLEAIYGGTLPKTHAMHPFVEDFTQGHLNYSLPTAFDEIATKRQVFKGKLVLVGPDGLEE